MVWLVGLLSFVLLVFWCKGTAESQRIEIICNPGDTTFLSFDDGCKPVYFSTVGKIHDLRQFGIPIEEKDSKRRERLR